MTDRGEYRNTDKGRRLILFAGLKYERSITPTDVDLMLEFADSCYIFGEFKEAGAPLPNGQRMLLERLCQRVGPVALAFVAEHSPDPGDIVAAPCNVVQTYRNLRGGPDDWAWRAPSRPLNVEEAIDRWRRVCGIAREAK